MAEARKRHRRGRARCGSEAASWARGGVAAGWLVWRSLGFAVSATLVLVAIGTRGCESAACASPGITLDQRMASRPWRDGQDVFRSPCTCRTFVITPSGSLLAPCVVEPAESG